MDKPFTLHQRLQEDCFTVKDLPLCRVLLMNETRYPWFILVPRVAGLTELMQLSDADARQYWFESALTQRFLSTELNADKLNVAALGNVVPQLHVHHIGRFSHDEAWPAPVWGKFPAKPYSQDASSALISQFIEYTQGEPG
ncbi:HIT domain-containing protein [Planctobacterium marinum]|uniref:HIT domain-containing protein n=1 Tax=Planctobacterium marinum TaxID=1631968 RepID=UPI001E3D2C94|nr:HIT domain-containing protein [Planctobacterium marinum]MCC2604288.1 HIT domain-containing protein [Planctobacterium marinum]